ncbi:ABC transporter permease [Cellulosilyticum sp. I15G10I2]|uniref:ABC transporter permease n=1 Tax=Cellulosilyticum sp. I15G10I2 TaxID=1892843 RepID=UPI00085BCE44|nr:ABC transporter permease [Cellulosilyticum sp. I15G10I2]
MGRLVKSRLFWPLIALVVLLLFNAVFTKNFFSIQVVEGHLYGSIIDILKNVAPLALLAIGMTMVIATGGIDISVGSVVAISGAIACSIIDGRIGSFNNTLLFAILLALASGVVCGIWNGLLVAKIKVQPVVATLILMTAGRGIAQLITKGKIVTINSAPMVNEYYFIGAGYLFGLPFALFIVLIMLGVILIFVKRTSFGLFLESLGTNNRSSHLAGIEVDKLKLITYVISGVMAALAGILISSNIKGADCNNAGLFIELDAILSVAIGGNSLNGGRFSIGSSVIGALVIQCLTTTVYALGVPPQTISLVKALVIIAICLFQSNKFRAAAFGRFMSLKKSKDLLFKKGAQIS